LNHNNKLII